MAYGSDLPSAARRHLHAAEVLDENKRRDVAGYLYGIAAECAVKAIAIGQLRQDDWHLKHFPDLRTLLRDGIYGRKLAVLSQFINDDSFMNNWDVKMRYASGKEILDRWVDDWKRQARQVVSKI